MRESNDFLSALDESKQASVINFVILFITYINQVFDFDESYVGKHDIMESKIEDLILVANCLILCSNTSGISILRYSRMVIYFIRRTDCDAACPREII